MKRLQYLLNDELFLIEANIINAGKEEITIKDSDGKEVENIHTLDRIITRYLTKTIFNNRTTPEIKQWFKSNFYNWIKKGAIDPADDMMDEKKFQKIFYVPLKSYIKELLRYENDLVKKGKLSEDIVLNSFPEFVRKNPDAAVIFSSGRLFRLKKITNNIEKVQEFLIANEQNRGQENDILPSMFQVKNINRLQFPEAVKRTVAWHKYVEQQAEKVDVAKSKQLVKGLKSGIDFKVIDNSFDDIVAVQLKTEKAAEIEGRIMKHCLASYGRDIELGKSVIYSIRNKDMVPVATIDMRGKQATQVKGPHNSTIKPQYHDSIREFFKKNKISVGPDARNFGGMTKT